jgi:hypothetical protein
MVSLTLNLDEQTFEKMSRYSWINWSEIARVEMRKREIFEKSLKQKKISNEDWKFCEAIDWHPVDELPLKAGLIRRLKLARKEQTVKLKHVNDIFT